MATFFGRVCVCDSVPFRVEGEKWDLIVILTVKVIGPMGLEKMQVG